jgi:hypothetical protein
MRETYQQALHVMPIDDLKPHNCDGGKCWCNPEYDLENDMWIHNSMDRREEYECGRKPS